MILLIKMVFRQVAQLKLKNNNKKKTQHMFSQLFPIILYVFLQHFAWNNSFESHVLGDRQNEKLNKYI